MLTEATIRARFTELAARADKVRSWDSETTTFVHRDDWGFWTSSALNLVGLTFGKDSDHYQQLQETISANSSQFYWGLFEQAKGIFLSAKDDFENGFYQNLEKRISGEVFGDFVVLAKGALADGKKDVAAVLACAALEDALKRFAAIHGLKVDGKTMDTVVGMLKSAGLVQGAQKSLLDAMPRVRNCAMHADWAKITEPDVNSVIGFVESFLQTKF